MTTVTISDARRFSLQSVQETELISSGDLTVTLFCFEAGQQADEVTQGGSALYQVLEGELLLRRGDVSQRVGKGKLVAMPGGTTHLLENAGGGLLVVMATTSS
jgi:quercetin dioxygenase-like cupin family protein